MLLSKLQLTVYYCYSCATVAIAALLTLLLLLLLLLPLLLRCYCVAIVVAAVIVVSYQLLPRFAVIACVGIAVGSCYVLLFWASVDLT